MSSSARKQDQSEVNNSGAIPIAIAILTFVLSVVQISIAVAQRQTDLKIAESNLQHEVMSKYLEEMTDLLVNEDGSLKKPDEQTSSVASAMTLNASRQLTDPERKGQLLKFLYDAELIGRCNIDPGKLEVSTCDHSKMSLSGIKLIEAKLEQPVPSLAGINLSGASLNGAELTEITLTRANLKQAKLEGAVLNRAVLNKAEMQGVRLQNAKLEGAHLQGASLIGAVLTNADLRDANLSNAHLQNADLRGADLRGADLTNAKLEGANLEGAIYLKKSDNQAETKFPAEFDPTYQKMSPAQSAASYNNT
jgi:uncharacterized protein YjbI with pentapeptide repeats